MKYIKSPFLIVLLAVQLVLPACKDDIQGISITLEADYSSVIAAINDANRSLAEKLALIEATFKSGLSDNQAAMKLIQDAVASLSGTTEQKLAAIEAAVKSQTTNFEMKLALVEAAVVNGFADSAAQQELLQQAIASLEGTVEEKMAAIETAVRSQTASLETKLALIEAAVEGGFADQAAAEALILEAIETQGDTLEKKLAAIEAAIESQTTTLEAKLALIEAAAKQGTTGVEESLALIQKAIETLEGTLETKLAAIEETVASQNTSFSSKLALIQGALTSGFADEKTALGLMQTALEALKTSLGEVDTKLTDSIDVLKASIGTLAANFTTGGDVATALANILTAIQSAPDYSTILGAIQQAIIELEQAIEASKACTLYYLGEPSYTVTKGQDITVQLRVNPPSRVLSQDTLEIVFVESKQFFPAGASGTTADHFSIKSLVADPSSLGQYNVKLTTDSNDIVWDEATLAFKYNFGTIEKPQYSTTDSFQAVMMPRPVNGNQSAGLIPWKYPYASFCAVDSFFNAQGHLYPEDTLGVVYYALDKVTFEQKNGSESRVYTASNIVSSSFTPIDGNTAPVKCVLDNEKHYVCFYPDTTNSKKWRDFQSATGVKREDVAGILSLTDQWGVTSTYGVNMTWFNTYELNVELNISIQNDQSLVKGNNAYYPYNLTDKFLELGLDDDLMKDTRYGLLERARALTQQETGAGYEDLGVHWKGSNREVDLLFNKPGNALAAGQKYRHRGQFQLTVNPSDNTPNFTPKQVILDYCITVTLTD